MKRLLTFDQLNELSNWNQVSFVVDLLWNEIKKEIGENESHKIKHYTSYSYLIFNCEKNKIEKIEKIIKKYTKRLLNLNTLISGVKFDEYDNEARICIKNLHTKRVKPNKHIYHCSNRKNRNSILEHGLKLTDHSQSNYKNQLSLTYPPSIFATNKDLNDIWSTDGYIDVWEIDTEKLPNKWWYDLNLYDDGRDTKYIMTFEPIPPEFIKLIRKY